MEKIKLVNKHKVRRGAKRNQLDKISQDFANSVRKKLGNHVKEIILFGSHAKEDLEEAEKIIDACETYLAKVYKVSKDYWKE